MSELLYVLIGWIFSALQGIIFVRVVLSFIPHDPYQKWVQWVHALSDPLLVPFQRLIPPIGGSIDISPIFAWLLLQVLHGGIIRILSMMGI